MQSDQQHYDLMTSRLLCAFVYNPTKHDEFQWTVYSRQSSGMEIDRPKPIDDEHVVVYDLRAKKWIQLLKEAILRVEYPYFAECCLNEQQSEQFADGYIVGLPEDVIEPLTPMSTEIQSISATCMRNVATPMEYCLAPGNYANHFDKDTYEEDVKELIDEFELEEDEPWLGNFTPIPSIVKWKEVMEYLYEGSSNDLLNDQLDLKKVSVDWSELIDAKKTEALEFLETEKRELQNEIKQEPENAEDYQEEIEEIEVIVDLINSQSAEYKSMLGTCDDIYDVIDNWPPILLPMPFKFNAIDPSQDPTFSDKYDEE